MEALGQLTGGIAHDFNNMLAVIKSGVSLLEHSLKDITPELRRLLDGVMRSVDRGASLTQRLLAFARRQPLDPQPIDPNQFLREMSDLITRSLTETISVETVYIGGVWRICVDSNQLEQTLLNLIINARDAMPGGGKLTLETANILLDEAYATAQIEVKPGQYVMISVSDTGAGMSQEVINNAFEPFYTTKPIGQGTGLGLSQAHGFIKQSGGHIKIYSELGRGTTVKLYLPRYLGAEESRYPIAPSTPALTHSNETILIVEDEEYVRAFTAEIVSNSGYRVLTAPDAKSALHILEQEKDINLLLTDVGLPGGTNGRQLADEARQRRPKLKVLYMTGYARNAIIHGGTLDPGVELISKPFSEAELSRKIRRVLDDGAS
jgi:CheY-like chemotaxis protein